uniref:Uncharacterized protein n=1 Tax=Arundo donax TaxID=35708 RepID=A0A0A9EUK0_ARUDO
MTILSDQHKQAFSKNINSFHHATKTYTSSLASSLWKYKNITVK